jgi:hypothetical protein
MSINLKINVQNLGPHECLDFSSSFSNLKIGIYAANGSGKTFLSRAFRCIENPTLDSSRRLISFNQSMASFVMEIHDPENSVKKNRKLELKLSMGELPLINNDTGYIFHVFNSDYVNENLEEWNFMPNGEIDGYVLGKESIDLSNERSQLATLQKELEVEKLAITKFISDGKKELESLKVRSTTKEYVEFTYEEVFSNSKNYKLAKSIDELKSENKVLNNLPDDLADTPKLNLTYDCGFFEKIEIILSTSFTLSSFSEEFKKKINSKKDFIENGLKIMSSDSCPFCEQAFNEFAKNLIDEYQAYIEDEESLVIARLDECSKNLEQLKKTINSNQAKFNQIKIIFDKDKSYFPSHKSDELKEIFGCVELEGSFDALERQVGRKKENIEDAIEINTISADLESIKDFVLSQLEKQKHNNALIEKLNSRKVNLTDEKLKTKREICRAKFNAVVEQTRKNVKKINEVNLAMLNLASDIAQKEQSFKTSKKELVADSFEEYLSLFFGNKYSFDRENFCLKFNSVSLLRNASEVLSEGEKSIVSFCYYLAETHKKMNSQGDYENLFFVIDDPISSLDFHYVYAVAQIIRNLDKKFNLRHSRFFVFTHSIEFMSVLLRNEIVAPGLAIRNKEIKKISSELMLPYEEHLRDVYHISIGDKTPSHTTANSIRHILETLNKFESPQLKLREYFNQIKSFENSAYLFSLIHDNSHGAFRQERAYSDEMIVEGCKDLITHIGEKFDGQIVVIQK